MKDYILDIYRDKKLTAKFGIIGGVGFICNFTALKALIEFGDLNKIVAEILAAVIALQVTFILHDRWTYRIDKLIHKYHLGLKQRYQAYLMSNSFASLLTVIFFALFSAFFDHLPALVLAAIVGMVWNFLINKNIIWHHKPHD